MEYPTCTGDNRLLLDAIGGNSFPFGNPRYVFACRGAPNQDALNNALRLCHPMTARWKSKFAGTINDR
jgi:hypothetical protein